MRINMSINRYLTAFVSACALFAAVPASAEGVPQVRIVSPANGATVVLGDDPNRSVPVELAIDNFTFKKLGGCGEMTNCGHAHLWIDPPKSWYSDLTVGKIGAPGKDSVCDNKAFPANNQNAGSGSNVIPAHFGNCKTLLGKHVIAVGLGGDNHNPIAHDGKPVIHFIEVTVVEAKK
jgi:hypothetical protein